VNFSVAAGLILAAAAVVAGVIVIRPTRSSGKTADTENNIAHFKRNFQELKRRQIALNGTVLDASPMAWRQNNVPMLTLPGWIFDQPIPIDDIVIDLADSNGDGEASVESLLPGLDLAGPITYSKAVTEIAGMTHFTNGVIYRPVRLIARDGMVRMIFERSRYFDYLDTCEVLAYKELSANGPNEYRAHLGDPFNLRNRVTSLGILTLTVLRNATPSFIMHKRTAKVVLGTDLFHVVPAGEFTPSNISRAAVREDFSLWRNISREYAEELLGHIDAQGAGGRKIDFLYGQPYNQLNSAREAGLLKVYVLGLGLDALTWKPELLTVAVFGASAFEEIFGRHPGGNYEGTIIEDIPFTPESVLSYTESDDTRSGAKACLELAWRHRVTLGLTDH
jgi:hypothetical protein